ncbi:uncharacterized protein [Typha angustifolia]|uniref:uncharacterized protein n=1 Tax=Typha angustifolia TaxID=59011 RepID=UPI003C2E4851
MATVHSLVCSNPSLALSCPSNSHKQVSLPQQTISVSSPPRLHRAMVAQAMDPQSVDGALSTKGDAKGANSAVDSDQPADAAEADSEWVLLHTNSDLCALQSSDNGGPPLPSWAQKVIGSVICFALPLYKKIRCLEDEVDKTVDTVIEIVEEVAEVTEKVASDIAGVLPRDGNLKEAVLKIEDIAEKLDKDAEMAEAFMNKVDEIREEEDTLLKPIIEEAEAIEKEIEEQEKTNPKADQDQK